MRRVALATAFMTILTAGFAQAEVMYVTAKEGLRIRSEPSEEAEILSVLPFATEVDGEIKNGWMQTNEGYLSEGFLSDTDPLSDAQYLGTWRVTAYASTGNTTASGTWPEVGWTLATNDLPFGSLVYVRGQGIWRVEDRGPVSMGSEWCDLFLGDTNACIAWGDQRLDIYLLQ